MKDEAVHVLRMPCGVLQGHESPSCLRQQGKALQAGRRDHGLHVLDMLFNGELDALPI
jgi:hypothetical protein